jgi:hypothetical protein
MTKKTKMITLSRQSAEVFFHLLPEYEEFSPRVQRAVDELRETLYP